MDVIEDFAINKKSHGPVKKNNLLKILLHNMEKTGKN